jgi:hypothetical protein
MITIHWEGSGIPLGGMVKATGKFVDLLSKLLARNGARTAWLWTHENGENKGGHLHLLAHVPPDLVDAITRLQRSWLRRITGQAYRKRIIRSRPIGGRLGLETGNPALHSVNLDAAMDYVLKGTDEATAILLNMRKQEPGGLIIGKRCGTSQNIGSKARNAAEPN